MMVDQEEIEKGLEQLLEDVARRIVQAHGRDPKPYLAGSAHGMYLACKEVYDRMGSTLIPFSTIEHRALADAGLSVAGHADACEDCARDEVASMMGA